MTGKNCRIPCQSITTSFTCVSVLFRMRFITIAAMKQPFSIIYIMADPDFEVRGRGGFVLLALPAFFLPSL